MNSSFKLEKLFKNPFRKLICFLAFLFILSCGGGSGGGGNDNTRVISNDSIIQLTSNYEEVNVTSNEDGKAAIFIQVPAGTSHLNVTANSLGNVIQFNKVDKEDGRSYLNPGGERLTSSVKIFPTSSSVNFPSRLNDPALIEGELIYLEVSLGSIDNRSSINPLAFQNVNFLISSKSDGNLGSGTIQTNIYTVGDFASRSSIDNALNQAIDLFKNIYAENAGINLSVSVNRISGPEVLPNPAEGSNFYLDTIQGNSPPSLNIFIGTEIQFSSNQNFQLLGFSAGIPGSPANTERSIVAISLLANSGVDGIFSDSEIVLLGETLAHEAGHYLGLFHPVDISPEGNIGQTDPLSDTSSCGSEQDCLSNPDIFRNLMFGFPVVDNQGDLIEQFEISAEQRGVLNSYLAVD